MILVGKIRGNVGGMEMKERELDWNQTHYINVQILNKNLNNKNLF